MPTGGDVLLQCLQAQGVRAVFGMPGTQNIGVYDAFHRAPGLKHYLIRHEQAATLMANGYARACGQPAVALTVPGPGASNASTGVVDAWTDGVPLLLIVGGYDRPVAHRDRAKMFHGLNQEEFFRPITRSFGCPNSVAEIPGVVEAAFRAMYRGRPGPVVIEIPPDVALETTDKFEVPAPVPRYTPAPVNPAAVQAAATAIRNMQRPVILVGRDCVPTGAGPLVEQLAERLEAPVIYGRLGKGVIADAHPWCAGYTRTKRTIALLREADGLIAVGTRFTQIDTLNWTLPVPANLVQFDRDARELGREYPISAGVSGCPRQALTDLLSLLGEPTRLEAHAAWSRRAQATIAEWKGMPPVDIQGQIRQALPADGLVSVDVTSLGYNCFDRFAVPDAHSLIYPANSVTLGMAFPAAVGAKAAQPDRAVVSFSGDGGFLMACNELATAVEANLNVVAVVVRDNSLTAIKGSQQMAFAGRTVDTEMRSPDFAAMARCFGAHGESTDDLRTLPERIAAGLARSGPSVIEVRLEGKDQELIAAIPWLHGE